MRVSVHFTAMPLAYPLHPSSQLGTLAAFVTKHFTSRMNLRSHHAFLPILNRAFGPDMTHFFSRYSLVGEEILYLCCAYSAMMHNQRGFAPAEKFAEAYKKYHEYSQSDDNDSQQFLVPISVDAIMALTEATEAYVDETLYPSLDQDGLNLIGYTASFCQVFGSILAAQHVERLRCRDKNAPKVINLFGGSSFSLPEGRRTLGAWNLDGLIVKGTGEAPLMRMLSEALTMPEDTHPRDALRALSHVGGQNVTTVSENEENIDLSHSQELMTGLPDPDYDDYFSELRALCDNDNTYDILCRDYVSLPIEGSRGCFAKCDFCHNPNITAEFRSLNGKQVAERALRLVERYKVNDVTFVDSVCNTWAPGYADYLIERGIEIPAFLELRSHEDQAFWTKMARCGATRLQLGIEAISSELLRGMKKGTRVVQNLSATKYMCEMGIRDASNLIIHHPKSTVADVLETIRVMKVCEHFPIFNVSRFVLSYASPLYFDLDEEKKSRLNRGFDWLPEEMTRYGWPRHLSYTWPNAWTEPQVTEAWTQFQEWYESHCQDLEQRQVMPTLDILEDCAEYVLIQDTRFDQRRTHRIDGQDKCIVDACHKPSKMWNLIQVTGLDEAEVLASLERLTEQGLVVKSADDYLTIALRDLQHARMPRGAATDPTARTDRIRSLSANAAALNRAR